MNCTEKSGILLQHKQTYIKFKSNKTSRYERKHSKAYKYKLRIKIRMNSDAPTDEQNKSSYRHENEQNYYKKTNYFNKRRKIRQK